MWYDLISRKTQKLLQQYDEQSEQNSIITNSIHSMQHEPTLYHDATTRVCCVHMRVCGVC